MAKYTRAFSIDHRNKVVVDSSDPRAKNLNQFKSRLGRQAKTKKINEFKALERYFELEENYILNGIFFSSDENYIYTFLHVFSLDYSKQLKRILVKLNADTGQLVWYIQTNNENFLYNCFFDLYGNFVVVDENVINSYSPSGQINWSLDNSNFISSYLHMDIVNGHNALYLGELQTSNIKIRKINCDDGSIVYTQSIVPVQVSGYEKDYRYGYLGADTSGNVYFYFCDYRNVSNGISHANLFLVKLDPDGNILINKVFNNLISNGNNNWERPYYLSLDDFGFLGLITYKYTIGSSDPVYLKINYLGQLITTGPSITGAGSSYFNMLLADEDNLTFYYSRSSSGSRVLNKRTISSYQTLTVDGQGYNVGQDKYLGKDGSNNLLFSFYNITGGTRSFLIKSFDGSFNLISTNTLNTTSLSIIKNSLIDRKNQSFYTYNDSSLIGESAHDIVKKFNSSHSLSWSKSYIPNNVIPPAQGTMENQGSGVKYIDNEGSVYLHCQYYLYNQTSQQGYTFWSIQKYDSNGLDKWNSVVIL